MSDNRIRSIIILGGGTAGWMTAATLARFLKNDYCSITLLESDSISTIGVGEATIPQLQIFNKTLGIDEDDFIRRTKGTFKLGIEFVDWGKLGDRYIHAFGEVGKDIEPLPFYHYWWKLKREGKAQDIAEYTLNSMAAPKGKFMRSIDAGNSPLSNIAYAFQFDAGLYANFLREYAEERGVVRKEGKMKQARLNAENGFIDSLQLESGEIIAGDFFIDCSGLRALLIGKAMNVGFEDWAHWLPCDSALAAPCEKTEPLLPFTRSTAQSAGWQWRIPLQHRTGNGHVFSSQFMEEEEAKKILLGNLDGKLLADPRLIKFKTGKREKLWEKNCVAIGLSGGFMEPLESTSIYMVQSALARLMNLFPSREFNEHDVRFYNNQSDFEYRSIRDFLILHYKATEREDSEFWRYCSDMPIPDTLQQKIDQYLENGQLHRRDQELFNETSWLEVFHGQNMHPKAYHPLADVMPEAEIARRLEGIRRVIARSVDAMPQQEDFIRQYCAAEELALS